jgi:hypothetical protein
VRALAMTSVLPDVPTLGVPGFEASTGQGIGAPRGTPPEIVERLNQEINAALADSTFKLHLADLGSMPMPMSPPISRTSSPMKPTGGARWCSPPIWGKVVRTANIKPE